MGGSFNPTQTAKDWTVFFDNKKGRAEMLLKTDDKNLAIGVVVNYGKSADKKIIEDLKNINLNLNIKEEKKWQKQKD